MKVQLSLRHAAGPVFNTSAVPFFLTGRLEIALSFMIQNC